MIRGPPIIIDQVLWRQELVKINKRRRPALERTEGEQKETSEGGIYHEKN